MRSPLPKVLHALAGRSMLEHVLAAARSLSPQSLTAVVSDDFNTFAALAADVKPVVQRERLGTGHAVRVACDAAAPKADAVLVLYGDTPLLTAASMRSLLGAIAGGADVAVLGFTPVDAGAYGRLVVDSAGTLTRIVEYNDASPDERAIRLCNAGIMAFRRERLLELLPALTNTNSKGEYYLTDLVGLATSSGGRCAAVTAADENDVLGVNSRAELAVAEGILQGRLRAGLLEKGVTLPLPETVYLSADLDCAADVIIEPFVYIGAGVRIAAGAHIRAFSHLEGAWVGERAVVGPYARLRPGSVLGVAAHVGNFVELKATTLGDGAKANHLSYLGDTSVGANANIGAGTITCNYNGFTKERTVIGAGAFVGSDTCLVAPVTVGAGAIIGAGSVVVEDVPDDALAVGRSAVAVKPGGGAAFRAKHGGGGKAKKS